MSRLKNAQSPGEPLPPCVRWVWGWAGLASRTNSKVNGNYDAGSVTLQHDRQRRPSFSYSLKGKKHGSQGESKDCKLAHVELLP